MPILGGRLVGGPLDGGTLAPAARSVFVWVSRSDAGSLRGYGTPGRDRLLYRSQGGTNKHETFLFAGHTHARCGGCGGYNELGEGESKPRCELCGAGLTKAKA